MYPDARRVLDLFCGAVGGFTYAARWGGLDVVAACEIDPWRREVYRAVHHGPLERSEKEGFLALRGNANLAGCVGPRNTKLVRCAGPHCRRRFVPERSTGKFCSTKCRVANHRAAREQRQRASTVSADQLARGGEDARSPGRQGARVGTDPRFQVQAQERAAEGCDAQASPAPLAPQPPASNRLPVLAHELEAEHQAAREAARSSMQHALRCGELLKEAKRLVGHGAWEAWVRANCSFSPRTARVYMGLQARLANLAEPDRQRAADLTSAKCSAEQHGMSPG